MKLAARILDIQDDPDGVLLNQAAGSGVSIPAYVQEAKIADIVDPSNLPDEMFALVIRNPNQTIRKYACDTPARTWLNGLYFGQTGHSFDAKTQQKVAAALLDFSRMHGIEMPYSLEKSASGDFVLEGWMTAEVNAFPELCALNEGGRGLYPIATWDQVKMAMGYFEDYSGKFTPAQRREFCVNVSNRVRDLCEGQNAMKGDADEPMFKAAALKGQDPAQLLSPKMRRYASDQACPEQIKQAFHDRMRILEQRGDEDSLATYQQLLENCGSLPLDKFAQVLEDLDTQVNLRHLYGKRLDDPYWSVLKIAEEVDPVLYGAGNAQVRASQVKKLAAQGDLLGRHYDPQFAKDFAVDPVVVFGSLPDTDKQAIAHLALSLE